MEKRERAQKMKRDKKKKDAHRVHDHSNKPENKANTASMSKSQVNATKEQKTDVKPGGNKENVEEVKETQQEIDFSKLKRETEEINQLNTKTYSKRQVTSNWAKYETPLPPDDDELISKGADFEALLGAPISEGGHFKFKSEQMWSQNPLQFSDIFSLNVKHLAKSLSCLPFYEQLGISKELFSAEELAVMEMEAKQNSDRHKNLLDEPVVINFYEILKSSLVESPVKKNVGLHEKLDSASKSTFGEPSEDVIFTQIQVNNMQDVKKLQIEGSLESSSETQDFNFRLKKEEMELDMQTNQTSGVLEVVTGQISLEREPSVSIEHKNLSREEEVENKVNITSAMNETEVPVPVPVPVPATSASTETNSQTGSSTIKETPREIDDDDELDFLLTLKQPVSGQKFAAKVPTKPVPANDILSDDLGALSLTSTTETKAELEDWLDSMLAD